MPTFDGVIVFFVYGPVFYSSCPSAMSAYFPLLPASLPGRNSRCHSFSARRPVHFFWPPAGPESSLTVYRPVLSDLFSIGRQKSWLCSVTSGQEWKGGFFFQGGGKSKEEEGRSTKNVSLSVTGDSFIFAMKARGGGKKVTRGKIGWRQETLLSLCLTKMDVPAKQR